MLTYYSKDASTSFTGFLQNPRAAVSSRSVLEPGESDEITEEDLFAGLWSSLTEEDMEGVEGELKAGWEAFAALNEESAIESRARSSGNGSGANYSPIVPSLGTSLREGDVIVESSTGSAYVFGTYNHAGIFNANQG